MSTITETYLAHDNNSIISVSDNYFYDYIYDDIKCGHKKNLLEGLSISQVQLPGLNLSENIEMYKGPDFPIEHFNKRVVNENEYYYSKTQNWLGHIESISQNSFFAKLKDLTNGGTDEIVELEIEEVSDEDKSLICIGAAFYWSIGYSHENGQVSRKSIIRFQRLIELTEDDINLALDRANEIDCKLKWE